MAQDSVNMGMLYPTISLLIFHSSFSFHESLVSYVYLTVLYTCCFSLYELKIVHGHHIRRHTELDGTSDVLDGDVVSISLTFVQFLIFQTSNDRQKSIILQRNVDMSLL